MQKQWRNPENRAVLEALKFARITHGGLFWRANSGGGSFGHKCNSENLSDIVGCSRYGQACFYEVKNKTGRLDAAQLLFLHCRQVEGAVARLYVEGGEVYSPNEIPTKYLPPQKRAKK